MSRATALIVDDEDQILEEYSGLFNNEYLEILTSNDPQEAVAILGERPVTVLVTDQRMPGMTGLELVQKAKVVSPETVRMILTAFADKEVMLDAINVGKVFRFMIKPCDPKQFVEAVTDAVDYAEKLARTEKMLNARKNYVDASSDMEILQTQLEEREAEVHMLMAESEQAVTKQKDSFKSTLASLVTMIQLKNQHLFQNGQWVASFAVKVGKSLGLSERELYIIQLGGYLKNVGLLLLPDVYSEKSLGMFNNDELRQYYRFPQLGAQVLKKLPGFAVVGAAISDQLERFDGSGPRGQIGDQITLPAQVLGIAHDAYQILYLRSKESGTESLYGQTFMINHIRKNLNKLYSPKLAGAAIRVLGDQHRAD